MEDELFDPAETDLEFVRNRRTRSVHVLVPLRPEDGMVGDTGIDYGVFTSWFRTRLLCGRVVVATEYFGISRFDDDAICMQCHSAMGEHSDRLFWHGQDDLPEA